MTPDGEQWNPETQAARDWERVIDGNPELGSFVQWLQKQGLTEKQAVIATCAALTAIFSPEARAERQSPTRPYVSE